MSAGTTDSKARLGVFVVSGMVLAIAGVLALGAARLFERTVPMYCYFEETVQGLDPGSPISYRGVRLGRVEKVGMRQTVEDGGTAMGNQAMIEVVCELDPAQLTRFGGTTPSDDEVRDALRREVAHGLRVRVKWKDITGQKYLELDYVDADQLPPPDLPFAPTEPYVPTASEKSLTDIQRDFAATLGNLAKIDYAAIAANLQVLLEQLTQKVSEFRADEVSTSIRDAAKAIEATARNEDLQRALARTDAIARDVETMVGRVNTLLAKPEIEDGVADLAAAAKSLRAMSDDLSKRLPATLDGLDGVVADARRVINESAIPETTAAVRDGVADVGGAARSIAGARDDLVTALRDLGDASRAIARLAESLERHPEQLLRGRDAGGAKGGQ